MTKEEAEGTTETAACRFWMVSWTVTRRPFHADVALAISSPTFLGACSKSQKTKSTECAGMQNTDQTQGANLWGEC